MVPPQTHDPAALFYDSIFAPIVDLFKLYDSDRASRSSGRPPGPVQENWRSLIVLASDALRGGIENLLLRTHLDRIRERTRSASNPTDDDLTQVTADLRDLITLHAPNASTIENTILLQFGISRGSLVVPHVSHFTARSKPLAWEGAGRGQPIPFESDWDQLSAMLNTTQHVVPNIDAHPLNSIPPTAPTLSEPLCGSLWATTKGGKWTVQIAHAATALRTFVSVFNCVAHSLDLHVQWSGTTRPDRLSLRSPDDVVEFS